ncbi:MAG: long-chain fatty acid--CoA ligase [Bdellovibrionia bacterium]
MTPATYENLLCAFWDQTKLRPQAPALVRKKNTRWETWTWRETATRVAQLSAAFKRAGCVAGDRVAIFADNCPEWVVGDFACMASGLVSVPLYPSLTESQVRYIIEHSEAKIAIVRGIDRLKKLLPIKSLEKIIVIDVTPQSEKTVAFGKFIERESGDFSLFAAAAPSLNLNGLATIVYTSGTTSEPKGVLLTHGNCIAQSNMLAKRAARRSDDVLISYLPLSHITERVNVFRQALVGYPLYFSQGLERILEEVKELKPTGFVAVPRIWEKLHESALAQINEAGPIQKRLLEKALEAGTAYLAELRNGIPQHKSYLRTVVFQRTFGPWVRHLLGFDRCRLFVSGTAPLDFHTLAFFYSAGMPMVEAYGMTECCGACHINHPDHPVFGTVGPVIDGMSFRIAADGEILLKGDNVFAGYYKDSEQTSETLRDGWLYTGDIGTVDTHGNLKITDRKKNIIITSGGKNIAPAPLEARLRNHPMINQAVVIGDRRKYLTALLTLAPNAPANCENQIAQHVDAINIELPSYETIKMFSILPKDFSVEGGELTPTMKVRRSFIQEKYKVLVDSMYPPAELRAEKTARPSVAR